MVVFFQGSLVRVRVLGGKPGWMSYMYDTFTFLILFAALFPDRDCAKPTIPSSFAKLAFTDFVNRSHHLFLRQIQLQ